MNDLEQEIMAKILNYFKENHNFPPPPRDKTPEIFYSPIGEKNQFLSLFACNLIRHVHDVKI
jgi:hypothetical protein